MRIRLTKFTTLETGADGGHVYLTSNIDYKGQTRKIIVFFSEKSDELKIKGQSELTIEGDLVDDKDQSLNLLNSKLIDNV